MNHFLLLLFALGAGLCSCSDFDSWVPDYCSAENVFDHSFYFWATTVYFSPPSGEFERPFYLEGREIGAEEMTLFLPCRFREIPYCQS